MIPITYSLKGNYTSSNLYYNTIKNFTDEVINESRRELLPIIKKYIDFINKNKLEELRTEVEYLFDFLTLGIAWKIYLIQALNLTYPEYYVLLKLYLLRRRNKKIKPFVDKVRGIIATISLRRKFSGIKKLKSYGKKELVKLLRWMEASGEFREEVKRLNLVKLYFKNKSRDEFNYDLKILLDFSNWFEEKAEKDLNKFTPEVNNFIKKNYKKFLLKEDVIFCGRKEAEYHLSMIGAELMNRAFKQDFEKSDKKALLLPACMKLLPEEKCKAKKFSLDYICTGCSPKCRINHYRKEGIEKGFEVHIIPHSSFYCMAAELGCRKKYWSGVSSMSVKSNYRGT